MPEVEPIAASERHTQAEACGNGDDPSDDPLSLDLFLLIRFISGKQALIHFIVILHM